MKHAVTRRWPGLLGALVVCVCLAVPAAAAPSAKAKAAAPVSKARQAEDKASQAKEAFDRGAFTDAVELYRQALALDPGRIVFAYGIAISAENQGDLDTARTGYQQFLQLAPASHPLAGEARTALERLTPRPAPTTQEPQRPEDVQLPESKMKTPIVVLADDGPPPEPQRWPVWTAYGLAGAFAIAGGIFAIAASRTDSDADRYRVAGSRAFDPTRISEAGARERLAAINGRWTVAAVFGGCALASGGVGVWLRLKQPSVATDGKSVVLAWQF